MELERYFGLARFLDCGGNGPAELARVVLVRRAQTRAVVECDFGLFDHLYDGNGNG